MTGRSASSGTRSINAMPSVPGSTRVQQDQPGLLRLDEAGHVLRVAGHLRGVPRVSERVPHVPQCLRVVVHHQDARPLLPGPPRVASGPGGAGGGTTDGFFSHRNRKGDPRALVRAVALGLDAAPVGFHQPSCRWPGPDPTPSIPRLSGLAVDARELPEQMRQAVGRHAPGPRRRPPRVCRPRTAATRIGGRRGRILGRVGEEVVQHLDEALPVSPHPGQVRRQVDLDGVPAAAAQEGLPGLLHQVRHVRRLGGDRQRARPRCAPHPAGR